MKKCIFYLPYEINEHAVGARMLRPRKMIQAFADIGYEVFSITGFSSERRAKIKEVKKRIEGGEAFDFMYAESHTEPTLLTNPNHLPTHPFLDYGFFNYIRKHKIKIGMFYCDIFWRFDSYGEGIPAWKKYGALINYKYDLLKYEQLLSSLYVADLKMCEYIKRVRLSRIAKELPPGAENLIIAKKEYGQNTFKNRPVSVFYVGGLGHHYQINELIKAVAMSNNCHLTICCRPNEWEKEREKMVPYINEKITIIHNNSEELEPLYEQADVCALMFKRDEYVDMAKPYKTFEYLSHETPILSTRGTAVGDFVSKNNIGWAIPFEACEIGKVLGQVESSPNILSYKRECCKKTKEKNLWVSRAAEVSKDLSIEE